MKVLTILLFLIAAFPVFAQIEGNPENWCRNGFFPRESSDYKLATVKAKKGEKVYFFSDENNCPNDKKCQKKSYVIADDEIIVSRTFGRFACGWFQPKKGAETVGWIPNEKLEYLNLVQSLNEYVGKWRFYDNEIVIVKTGKPSVFKITGSAFWRGLGDNVHTGELDGEAIWDENLLNYGADETDEYACKAKFDLIGRYLIVSDNLNCGGFNVTFSGVYTK